MMTAKEKMAQSYHWDMRAHRIRQRALERKAHLEWLDRYIERAARRDSGKLPLGLSNSGRVFILRGSDGCTYDCTNNANMGTHGYPPGTAIYERVGDALILLR